MFDFVTKNKRLIQVVLAVMMVPFAFFGLDSYTRSMGGADDVANVDGQSVTVREFNEEMRQQMDRIRGILGRTADISSFDTPDTRAGLLDSLVDRRVIATAAVRSRLTVSDDQLREMIANMQPFQVDGKFSKASYEALLQAQNLTPAAFESKLRYDVALSQLNRALAGSAIQSRAVSERLVALGEQQREVQESLISGEGFLGKVTITEAAAKAFFEANQAEFRTPEMIKAEYLVLAAEQLGAADPVTEDEVKAAYASRSSQYRQGEQRRVSHILIPAAADAKPADKEAGGDLGEVTTGMMVKPFEEVAFKLKSGETSDVVETEFGYHIIRVTEVQAEQVKPLETVRAELTKELAKQKGTRRFAESAEVFSNLAYEQSDSLKPAAERFKLQVQRTDWIPKAASKAAGMLANPKLLGALFSSDSILSKRNTDAIEVAPNVLVSARVVEHRAAAQLKFEEVKADIENRLRRQEASKLAQQEGAARLAALTAGKAPEIKWSAVHAVSRAKSEGLPPEALRQILSADPAKLPAHVGYSTDGGYVIYRVGKVIESPAKGEKDAKAAVARIESQVGGEQFAAYVASLRARAKVEVNKANLEKKGQ
ncbi:MAG: SurA N-terminal domain-containing protein [Proteobacteria bacterium]|nr:SurA N-terminal domain-containing protein [Pseudomonadota bacterium]